MMMTNVLVILRAVLIICCLIPLGLAHAASTEKVDNEEPLWELGVIGWAATFPHYPGSDEYYTFALPVPYFIYRGERFKAGRDGFRGLFFHSDRIEFDVSTGGNLPVSSDNNKARRDMPELHTLLEIGPAIRYFIYRSGDSNQLYLDTAVRGAFSFEFNGGLNIGVDYRGHRYTMDLRYKNETLFKDNDIRFFLSTGISYADNLLNGYFYDVDPEFVTPERGPFDADAGYTGYYLSGTVIKNLSDRLAIGGSATWRNLSGAVFEDSPLVRTRNNYSASIFFIWMFLHSDESVPN